MTTTLDPHPPPPPPLPAGRPSGAVPRWTLTAFVAGGAVFLAIALVAALLVDRGPERAVDPSGWRGVLMDPAPERPDFVLTDTEGRPFDFRAETGGRLTLLFYGYTHCPDICPIHLATIAQALDKVNVDATVVFVTSDPARDNPERIRNWLDGFDTSFVGLYGTTEEVTAAQRSVGAAAAILEPPDARGNYLVGHNSAVWVITPDDRVRLRYGFGTRLEDWVADLPAIAGERSWREVASP